MIDVSPMMGEKAALSRIREKPYGKHFTTPEGETPVIFPTSAHQFLKNESKRTTGFRAVTVLFVNIPYNALEMTFP